MITAKARLLQLTKAERMIVERLVSGLTKKAIAAELKVRFQTVETNCRSAMKKTGTKNLAQLVRLALDAGVRLNP
jgi:two-component system, LuxR family, response regulator FixJ